MVFFALQRIGRRLFSRQLFPLPSYLLFLDGQYASHLMSNATSTHDFASLINLDAIWRQRKLIVLCVGLTLSLGVVYLAVSSPKYSVEARLLVEDRGRILDPESASKDDFLPTQAEIIRSPTVLNDVLKTLALPVLDESGESNLASILKRLQVEPLLGTNVLSIEYHNSDPELAVRTVNAVIIGYKTYLKGIEQAMHQETIALLAEREKSLRAESCRLHADYEQLRTNSPLMGQDRDAAQVQRAMLMTLGESLTTAKRRRIELSNQLNNLFPPFEAPLAELGDGTFPTTITTNNLSARRRRGERDWRVTIDALSRMTREGLIGLEDLTPIQQALLEAESRHTELCARFGPKHPEVLGVRQVIDSLESRLSKTAVGAPEMLETELAAIRQQEQSLTDLYNREFKQAKTTDSFLVKEQQLLDEIQSAQTAHESLVSQLDSFELADQALIEGRMSITVDVLDGPELINDLVWPQPIPVLGLCGLIGLAGGIVLVGVRQQLAFSSQ
jgi:uncharacterized protein involved in exopolysaccharide biosynthesis